MSGLTLPPEGDWYKGGGWFGEGGRGVGEGGGAGLSRREFHWYRGGGGGFCVNIFVWVEIKGLTWGNFPPSRSAPELPTDTVNYSPKGGSCWSVGGCSGVCGTTELLRILCSGDVTTTA